jgi:hypothetical protein
MTMPAWLDTLEDLPRQMAAEVVAWLPDATRDGYATFLDMMYHYTLSSEARLVDAAARTEHPELRAFYQELADEEAPHYMLAARDLATFDRSPSEAKPPEVAAFEAMWAELDAHDELARLGALFVLESVADHVAADAPAALARLSIRPDQATFVLEHMEVDERHGAMCRDLCARLGARRHDALLHGARAAAHAWVDMHRCLGA